MPDFTAGPWRVNSRVAHSHEIKGSGCELIADVFNFAKEQNALANAILISAAPDMYEALERSLMFMMNGVDNGYITMPDIGDSALETPNIIRKALAKARGMK